MRYIIAVLVLVMIFYYADIKTYLPESVNQKVSTTLDNNTPKPLKELKDIYYADEKIKEKMKNSEWIKIKDIPLHMQQAIISIEDKNFYQHGTFDISGILRATLVNIQAGEVVEGGSTITQQLAKNIFLTQEQTFNRKLTEALYAMQIENNFSKETILEIYLNTIYFGSGAYGIKEASYIYFKKLPQNLNIAESAMLAGIPAAPSVYSPFENYEKAKTRQKIVLETMIKNGFIGPEKAKEISEQKII